MKNLFDPKVKEEILSRIDKLAPDSKAQLRKMNINQNLRHVSMAFDVTKLNPTPSKVPPMPNWLFRFFSSKCKTPKRKS